MGNLQERGDFTWRLSDCEELSGGYLEVLCLCEELVGVTHRRRKKERRMSRCFTRFPISGLGEPEIYQNLVCFTRKWGFYLEELGQGCRII